MSDINHGKSIIDKIGNSVWAIVIALWLFALYAYSVHLSVQRPEYKEPTQQEAEASAAKYDAAKCEAYVRIVAEAFKKGLVTIEFAREELVKTCGEEYVNKLEAQ